MIYKYTYKNKKTGGKFGSNNKLIGEDIELVTEIRDGMMRNEDKRIIKKNERQRIHKSK